ncbi:MAG: hypothetical protein PHZ07_05390 [Patescibacteria group bacterium]|nr:hypothetical protein [Patescibacteria group bacterium]MDD4304814.1 hypothetical protein [Patescibacteria group bacterium]MDD4695787.1 hypothetical protein [Patescibacteria group bacterium]
MLAAKNNPNDVGGTVDEDPEVPMDTNQEQEEAPVDQEENRDEDRSHENARRPKPKNHRPGFFSKYWWWIVLILFVVIFTAIIIKQMNNRRVTPPAPTPVVAPVVAPVDTTGAAAHADSLAIAEAIQAHADSLSIAEKNYEGILYGKVMKWKNFTMTMYDKKEAELGITDSLIVVLGNEYNRILGDKERDPAICFYENGLKIKNQSHPTTQTTTQKPNTTPANQAVSNNVPTNYRVVKTLPRSGYITKWREWSTRLGWGTMGGDVNVEGNFGKNIASIPDETSDFRGCSIQIPHVVKDSLIVLRQRAVSSHDDPNFVTYESFNNRVIAGITSGMTWGGTKSDKLQKIDSAPINVRITHVMKNGVRVPISAINAKVYSLKLTREQAQALKLPAKFIPPAGKRVVFKVFFFGDGYGDVPQCNNICWQSYFE